ncbi:unnamed protein product [Lepeophtheirus salmonis]|uniref:(salmon louse) hypothetical protein n=1 Tax=Lepeophtheirus salmonis TaxID=72036 RepID=A0A7R8H7P8_LEPSM|nr:unnamed protein product [Lepeophtheirus salmonis]CAF2905741.1 unnamed protein product [Lepeophtheirus salmonis]
MIEAEEIATENGNMVEEPIVEKDTATEDDSADNETDGKDEDSKTKLKDKKGFAFPKFQVFVSPDKDSSMVQTTNKRRTSGSSVSFIGNDPYRPPEMSPETTLIEFISSSAAFHGVKKQNMRQLEWDILKVFTNNVMPANSAAWYMAKRRYYLDNAWENQLLPFLLKKYPDKFYVRSQTVEFLDVCTKDVARKKMNYMVNQGLYAYFSHKADEYGVYFFDPYYYEHTEPFHANLRVATSTHVGHRSKLLPTFFGQYESSFVFTKHNPYLVSLSKVSTPIKINTTGIIVKMIDKAFGIIQFPSGSSTEKALFCVKSLFVDGWQYGSDPLKLDAIKFDGYHIPGPEVQGRDYTWYAVLVWGGRKPSPKFCATKDDLTSSKLLFKQDSFFPSPAPGSPTSKSPSKSGAGVDDGMIIGEISEIRKNGAVVTMRSKGADEKAFIMGWRHESLRRKGYFLTTTQGVSLAVKDLVGYYIDPNHKVEPFTTVAHQIIVLKHAEEAARPNMITHPLGLDVGSPNTRNGILRQLANISARSGGNVTNPPSTSIVAATEMNTWKILKKLDLSKYTEEEDESYNPEGNSVYSSNDSSDYDSFDEAEEVTDGELNFLRDGIMELIVQENKDFNDLRLSFLQKVMQETNNLINTQSLRKGVMKGRPMTPSSSHDSGNATSAEVTPTGVSGRSKGKGPFWRMEKAFKELDGNYNTDDDPTYNPSDASDYSSRGRKGAARKNSLVAKKPAPLHWYESISSFAEVKYCCHTKKWIPNPSIDSDDESDRTFTVRDRFGEDAGETDDEIPEDELELLMEDAKKDPEGIPEDVPDPEQSSVDSADGGDSKEKSPKKPRKIKKIKQIPLWIRFVGGYGKYKINPKTASKEKKEENGAQDDPTTKKSNESSKVEAEIKIPEVEDASKIDETDQSTKTEIEGPKTLRDDASTEIEIPIDDYDSDVDPEYVPPPLLDSDCEYDEYSDAEIGEEEIKLLNDEKEASLVLEFVGPCSCADSTRVKKESKKTLNKKGENDCTDIVHSGKEVTIIDSQCEDGEKSDNDNKKSGGDGDSSSKIENESSSKIENDSSSKTENESSSKTENESSSKTENDSFNKTENVCSSETENDSLTKTENESSSKTENESSSKTENESSSKTENESSSKTENESSSKTENESSSKTENESSSKTENESSSTTETNAAKSEKPAELTKSSENVVKEVEKLTDEAA